MTDERLKEIERMYPTDELPYLLVKYIRQLQTECEKLKKSARLTKSFIENLND